MILFHITTTRDWRRAKVNGKYTHASLKNEGFIHLSTTEQIESVANMFFVGATDLLVLQIESERLQSTVRFDAAVAPDGSTQDFPHLYGPLNLDAIVQVSKLTRDDDGQFHLDSLQ